MIVIPGVHVNTIFEAIEKSVPVLMIDSSHNRESSALPYLLSAIGSESNDILISHGILRKKVTVSMRFLN